MSVSPTSAAIRNELRSYYVMMRICWLFPSANSQWTAYSVEGSRSTRTTLIAECWICCGDKTKVRPWRTFIQKGRVNCQASQSPENPSLCDGLHCNRLVIVSLLFFLCTTVLTHVLLCNFQQGLRHLEFKRKFP